MELLEIYNDDCFNIFPKIKDKSIDLFILDLPYGETSCSWDTCIDLERMWVEIKRMMKPSAVICFFCTTKFGYSLIKSNEKWFKYDLIWKKSRKVGFLSANKRQLRNHENIYVFNNDNNDDIEITRNIELRKYAEKVKEYINKPLKIIDKDIGNEGIHLFYNFKNSQFGLPIEKNYKKLIELYKIDKMKGFLKYKDMVEKWEKEPSTTYNPQKTEGKPYKCKEGKKNKNDLYNIKNDKRAITENKGDRHPTSVIEHENVYVFKEEQGTYNPQKTQGHKPYKDDVRKKPKNVGAYGSSMTAKPTLNKGDRFPVSIIEHENVYVFKKEQGTYNPQKTPREKDYKHSGQRSSNTLYNGDLIDCNTLFKKEDGLHPTSIMDYGQHTQPEKDYGMIKGGYYRGEGAKPFKRMPNDPTTSHPTSIIENTILEYKSVQKTLHRTEKPVGLLEYLIKSYSNEGEIVMDFTMGSASCGEACFNTKRKFIGIEMDDDIFVSAQERLSALVEESI